MTSYKEPTKSIYIPNTSSDICTYKSKTVTLGNYKIQKKSKQEIIYEYEKKGYAKEKLEKIIEFSKLKGNDLSTPQEQYFFPGLKNGDKWCLCVLRWKEALEAGYAPKVDLESTNEKALRYVSLDDLIKHAATNV